jgi:Ca2+-binding RTX toxin-like protein
MGTSLVNGLGGTAGFGENFLARNDDGSTPFIDLRTLFGSQGINFFGRQYTGFYLNNNGSLTFANPLGAYTPTSITGSTDNPIIAAYWADVDTQIGGIGPNDTRSGLVTPTPGGTSTGSDLVWYDIDPTTHTFTATWDDVGYYSQGTDKLNAFQISITQIGTNGDFDITYRYEAVNWTTGGASGGVDGLGGTPAHAGYSSGDGVDYLELPQSGNQDALLDLDNASNIGVPGTYVFHVRGGSTAPAISVGDASVVEGNGPTNRFIVVPVFLAAPSSSPITVQYATADGSAHGGQDYVSQSGILTFAPGVTQQSLFIEVIGDTAIEGNETLSVVLSNPHGAPIADGTATATIIDDDGLVVSDVSALEGTGTSPTAFTFTVSLLTAATGTVSVHYATENGTATAGPDYVATSGTLTFQAGETSKTVTVNVASDSLSEADETFNLHLSGAVGAGISDAIGVGTILNDDGLVVDDAVVREGTSSTPTTASVNIRLLTASTTPVSVHWATTPGSATSPADFTASSGTVTFAAGETVKTVAIPVIADSLIEGEQSFNVVLSNPTGTSIVDGTGLVRITDDDGFSVSDAVVTEGNDGTTSLVFTVTLGSALATRATVNYASANGTATAGSDYSAQTGMLTFLAGETSKTVTVAVNGDFAPEGNETLTLNLSGASGGTGILRATGTGTIFNDDGLSIADASVTEGNSGTVLVPVTVTLSAPASGAVTVAYTTQDGTATAGVDYVATSGTLVFAAGETSKTISVAVKGDTQFEGNETFRVLLSSPSGSALVDGSATVTIQNDDVRPPPSFRVVDSAIVEGTGAGTSVLRFQVALSELVGFDASVNYTTSNGTATAGTDYTATSGTLTIPAGSLFGFISVPITRDTAVEGNETFTVTLSSPSAGMAIADNTATGTILNDDVTIGISATSASKAEGNSGSTPFTFTVTRSGTSSITHRVGWAVSGAAISGADFAGGVLPSGTVTFAPGETTKVITVNVAGDLAVESNEAFTVTLSHPSLGATITTAAATGTILNDDSAAAVLSIAAANASKAEGQSGNTPFTFTVTRTGDTSMAQSAHWAVGGAAVTGADFAGGSLPSGTVTFAAGQTSRTITVNVAGDTAVEANEAFTVTLSNPSTGASLGTATATSTILNDDARLSISAVTASKAEGQSGSTPFNFTVTRTGDTSVAHSAHWAVGGTAVTGADFAGGSLPSGTVTFAAGQTSRTITVNVAADSSVETNEAFTVTLSNPSTGASLGTATATSTILNDDARLSISAVTASKAEGQSGSTPFNFTVTRTGDTSVAHSAHWAVGGTAVTGADFAGGSLPSGTVTFAAGQTSRTIAVNVAADSSVETNEAFTVTLSNPSTGASLGTATATSTILNDDARLSISAVTASKAEGQSGSTPFTFTVTRTGDTSMAQSAHWAVSGAAVTGADFAGGSLPSGTVTFAAGQKSRTITVNVAGDTAVEANEAFTVTLSSPSTGASLGTATATSTILNDDARLSISAVTASKAEGQSGSTPFTFTVTRTGDTSVAHSAHWAVGGAAVTGADFAGGSLPSGTVTFAAGQTSRTITVDVAADSSVETNEAFTVTLSNPSTGASLGTATATSTILNDDARLSISAVTASKAEGQSGNTPFTFTVTRTGDTSVAHSAHWAVGGAAVTGADFAGGSLPSGTVTFAAGQTSRTITVNVAGDTTVEANEAFTVTLSNPSTGASLGTATATSTILNDDASLSIISIATASADIAEGVAGTTTPFTFNVTRTGDTTAARSVAWTVGGSAVTGADFAGGVLPAGTVNFAAGETVKTISVSVAGDTAVEGDEGFTVTLSNPGSGASLGTASASGVIRNDDASSGNNPLTGTSNPSIIDYIDGLAGSDRIYGREGNDVLVGHDGNDLLDGGPGADVMVGGAGNDSYYVDQVGDIVLEVGPLDGVDTVFSSISYTLGEYVENLVLTGTAATNGTGNTADNVITGNAAANTLSGGTGNDTLDGGAGVDRLIGGAGADTFVFSSALVAGRYDTIAGFDAHDDTVKLSSTIFQAFQSGATVANSAFELGATATSSLTRLLFDSASGGLLYDRDGLGGTAAIQFASITGLTGELSAANFKIG